MKKLVKILSVFVKLGERAASLFGKVVDAADRLLHYKEYRRQKRVRRIPHHAVRCVRCAGGRVLPLQSQSGKERRL